MLTLLPSCVASLLLYMPSAPEGVHSHGLHLVCLGWMCTGRFTEVLVTFTFIPIPVICWSLFSAWLLLDSWPIYDVHPVLVYS